jgi:hypothetical protein
MINYIYNGYWVKGIVSEQDLLAALDAGYFEVNKPYKIYQEYWRAIPVQNPNGDGYTTCYWQAKKGRGSFVVTILEW